MGAAATRKTTNRDIRRAFGTEACATIEQIAETQKQMDAGLTELERKERILDTRTRELRGDVNVQAEALALFAKMTFWQRWGWLAFGEFQTPLHTPVSDLDAQV